jgi:branched-chain amino acid transport system substrate-binding protein
LTPPLALCAPNIFRSSFSNWQPSIRWAKCWPIAASKTWYVRMKYGAGEEAVAGFTEGFIKAAANQLEAWIPFPTSSSGAAHRDRCHQA